MTFRPPCRLEGGRRSCAEACRRGQVDLDPRLPRHLADRVGELLQPGLVASAAVGAEHRRRIDDEVEIALLAAERRWRRRRDAGRRAAVLASGEPVAILAWRPPSPPDRPGTGTSATPGSPPSDTGRPCPDPPRNGRDISHVFHTRSITGCWSESVPDGLGIAPRLERMVVRKDEIAEHGRSVRVAQAHLERNAAECLGNTQRLGKRVHRVHGADIASGTPPLAARTASRKSLGVPARSKAVIASAGLMFTPVAERLIHQS